MSSLMGNGGAHPFYEREIGDVSLSPLGPGGQQYIMHCEAAMWDQACTHNVQIKLLDA